MANKLAGGVKKGSVTYSHTIRLLSLSDGSPITGKVAADLTVTYRRQNATRQTVSLLNLSVIDSNWQAGGVKEDANGEYRIDLPDAALAVGTDGADYVSLHVTCAGAYPFIERIPLETQGAAEVYAVVAGLAAATATAVWAAANRALTAVGNIVSGVWDEPIAGHTTSGTTGAKLSDAASAGDPWDTLLPGGYTAGKAGYIVGTNVDAVVSTRAAASALTTLQGDVTTLGTNVGAVKTKTDQLAFASGKVAAQLLAAGDFAQGCADKVWGSATRTLTGFGTLAADVAAAVWAATTRTLSAFTFNIAALVWEETAASHNTAGTMGARLNTAGAAADPLLAAVPGSYAAGTAGYVIGNIATDSADIDAIKAKTDQLTFTIANVVDSSGGSSAGDITAIKAKTDQLAFTTPGLVDANATGTLTAAAVAQAVLNTAMTESYAADGAQFTLTQGIYMLHQFLSERSVSGVTMTIKKLDGTTTAATITMNSATNPTAYTRTA